MALSKLQDVVPGMSDEAPTDLEPLTARVARSRSPPPRPRSRPAPFKFSRVLSIAQITHVSTENDLPRQGFCPKVDRRSNSTPYPLPSPEQNA